MSADRRRQPEVSPTFRLQLDNILEVAGAAFRDPEVMAAMAEARHAAEGLRDASEHDPEAESLARQILELCKRAAQLLIDCEPGLKNTLGEALVLNLVIAGVFPEAGQHLPLRLHGIPGFPDRAVRVLLSDDDVQSVRQGMNLGQVWVNATDLTADQYRELWGLISFQQQEALGRELNEGGRPPGSLEEKRARVIEAMRQHPDWSDVEIFNAGRQAGLWPDDGHYYQNGPSNRKRVQTLRRRAGIRKI